MSRGVHSRSAYERRTKCAQTYRDKWQSTMSETEPVARKSPASGGSTAGPVGRGNGVEPCAPSQVRPASTAPTWRKPQSGRRPSRRRGPSSDFPWIFLQRARTQGAPPTASPLQPTLKPPTRITALACPWSCRFWVRPTNREPCDSAKSRAIVKDRRCAMAVWRW
jgi:hypothetical protein